MDLMIDLETFGSGPKAVIASIGAVLFDYNEPPNMNFTDRQFYRKIDARTQPGREFNADTIYFWMNQPDAARKELTPVFKEGERKPDHSNLVPLATALQELTSFCEKNKVEKLWCYGATFDHSILMDAYKQVKAKFPVSYRDLLDMRTFVYIMPKVERPNFGTSHNALDDAINQAIWMQKIYQESLPNAKMVDPRYISDTVLGDAY